MTSSKKKRGKQRKAAKNLAAANNISGDATTDVGRVPSSIPAGYTAMKVSPSQIVALVQKGNKFATEGLTRSEGNISFEINGVLPSVLGFLQKCEHEMLAKVVVDIGGDITSPTTWIKLLLRARVLEPRCCLQIAENIGPLVRCMCNDTKRVLFKSNKHWRDSIVPFVELIYTVLYVEGARDEKRKITDALFEHEGLLKSIVRWGFWEDAYRPDITKELGVKNCTSIVEWGRDATAFLVTNAADYAGDVTCALETIATTSIVSKEYDPNCLVSYVTGLIRMSKDIRYADYFYVLNSFIGVTDVVDKGVITEMIDFGINYTTGIDTAFCVARISTAMILQGTNVHQPQPSDARVAFAIRAGLIEMCLSLIDRFGGHESFGDVLSLFQYIGGILESVHNILFHQKTSKAIGQKTNNIEKELACLEKNAGISSNDKCKELLDMVRSVLYLNGAYCCRCNKSLGRNDIKRCNGCNRMTYCSIACQKEDWLSGHNLTCCKKHYTGDQAGVFQGRCWPQTLPESEREAEKLKALEVNMTMIQLKVFLDHSDTIQSQARSLGIPLHDCVVHFDLRKFPLAVEVQRYSEFYKSQQERRCFEEGRSKENITCHYFSSIFNGKLESGREPLIAMQRIYPQKWLSNKL